MLSEIERSLITTYRDDIYGPFVKAVEKYGLIKEGDRILLGISGGKDSFVLAKCLEEYRKHSDLSFTFVPVLMDPGFKPGVKERIVAVAETLGVELQVYESDVFAVLKKEKVKTPCFLCARMRRGVLYGLCEKYGCNKLALGHHFDDVIETTLLSLFYSGEIKTMEVKLASENHDVELIRPLYLVKEKDICRWRDRFGLDFVNCECPLGEKEEPGKRQAVKQLLKGFDNQAKMNIFRALEKKND